MEVNFRTNELRRCHAESARAIRRWGPDVGRRYIARIRQLYAASNFSELYNSRALRLHPLQGPHRGKFAIYLTGRWRLIVTQGDTEDSLNVEEVSNHYDD